MAQKPSTIFLNPKFKNAHFNPNFLQSNKIHVNPKFLVSTPAAEPAEKFPTQTLSQTAPKINPIIKNTRRTLIRAPQADSRSNILPVVSSSRIFEEKKIFQQHQLIKISKNKLVTAAHLMKCQQKENEIIKNTTESIIKSKKLQRKTDTKDSIYRLDRRQLPTHKKKKIVSTYSLRRVDTISPKKVAVTDRKLLKMWVRFPRFWLENFTFRFSGKSTSYVSSMININGVLYKSTSKKLEMTSSSSSLSPSEKMLVIRGENFILDSSGTKLKRDSQSSNTKLSRIDIGGLTYRASKGGSYERDNSHQVRNHLSLAKTKSISLLAPNALHKTNMICPIYRRLGKCLAYARGRCQKVHDQRYVIVCPQFIKNLCQDEKCLLSHNANLHKMPVCKYFLQGLCQKQRECLYLHKKLTDDTKLCAEFLRGYCSLADKVNALSKPFSIILQPVSFQCNLLHDFPKSTKDKKKFSIVRHKSKTTVERNVKEPVEGESQARYYIEDQSQFKDGNEAPKRGALGSLPSYIPLWSTFTLIFQRFKLSSGKLNEIFPLNFYVDSKKQRIKVSFQK